MAAQLLPIITKIANENSVDAATTENQDEDISNVSSKNISISIHFKNMPKGKGGSPILDYVLVISFIFVIFDIFVIELGCTGVYLAVVGCGGV